MASSQYIALARKYRPADFSQLRGQEILTKILNYAILNNQLTQGYLLTGIRGVGKTSAARIIAKTINCSARVIDGEHVKPCQQCSNCQAFNAGNHPDIIEMDAASRTSVDDIRQVIESCEYRPLIGQYKIFIIDEIHMLSKGAFNALLKVLEEPPPHIMFIFATTEVQKIPLTVISRCQRYDLRRLTVTEVLKLLAEIIEQENLQFDLAALKIIAAKSDGSAREAVALLDQATNLRSDAGENAVSAVMINQMLGLVDLGIIVNFVAKMIDQDARGAIELVNNIYLSSANLEHFIESASDFLAYLNKIKILTTYYDPVYDFFDQQVASILVKISLSQLSVLWQICTKGLLEIKTSHNQLVTTEMLVIKAVYSQTLPCLEELLAARQSSLAPDLTGTAPPGQAATLQQPASPSASDQPKFTATSSADHHPSDLLMIDFLQYLHNNHEMELYYLLLNQVEIKNSDNYLLTIAGDNINLPVREKITELLCRLTAQPWQVMIIKQPVVMTFKQRLLDQVKSSQSWQLINKNFSSAIIADILQSTS